MMSDGCREGQPAREEGAAGPGEAVSAKPCPLCCVLGLARGPLSHGPCDNCQDSHRHCASALRSPWLSGLRHHPTQHPIGADHTPLLHIDHQLRHSHLHRQRRLCGRPAPPLPDRLTPPLPPYHRRYRRLAAPPLSSSQPQWRSHPMAATSRARWPTRWRRCRSEWTRGRSAGLLSAKNARCGWVGVLGRFGRCVLGAV